MLGTNLRYCIWPYRSTGGLHMTSQELQSCKLKSTRFQYDLQSTYYAMLPNFNRMATFFDFHLPWLFPNLKEISLTSWYGILVETEIIRLNLRTFLKLLRSDNVFKFLDFHFFFEFPDYFGPFSLPLTFPWFPGQQPPCSRHLDQWLGAISQSNSSVFHSITRENELVAFSCPSTWLSSHQTTEIFQSLNGHEFTILKCINNKF